MSNIIWTIILFFLSFWEVWMCWELLQGLIWRQMRLRIWQKAAVLSCIVVIGIQLVINRQNLFFSHNMFFVCIIVTSIYACILIRDEILLAAELIVIYYAVLSLLDLGFAFLSTVILGEDFEREIFSHALSGWSILAYALSRCIVFVCIFLLKNKHFIQTSVGNFKCVLLPVSILLCIGLRFYQILLVKMSEHTERIADGWEIGVSLLAILSIICFILCLLLKNKSVQNENRILLVRDEAMQNSYQEMRDLMEKNSRIIHDIKNHLLTLQGMEHEKDFAGIHRYLEELGAIYIGDPQPKLSKNPTLDLILRQKREEARKKSISFFIKDLLFLHMPLSDREIVSVFGNLLDNSIEACSYVELEKRWISIYIRQREQMLFIEIKNSVDKLPIIKNGMVQSTKLISRGHGYGLKNVRRIVEQYGGEMSFSAADNTFCVHITFFHK